jgi:hypothetical protein
MRHKCRIAAMAIVVIAASVLCGCAQTPIPNSQELVGTWHHKSDGAIIVLKSNGSAILENVPRNALLANTEVPNGVPIDLTGTWAMGGGLGEKRENGQPLFTIDLHNNANTPVYGISPLISGTGNSLSFSWGLGDPDSDKFYVFTR